jgi:hypothetical protein
MNAEPDELDGQRWGWHTWVMVALLVYLWGWLVVCWFLADFIDGAGWLVSILRFVYWPLAKLAELSFRGH